MKELYIFFILFIGLLFGAGVLTVIVLYFRSFVGFLWGTSEKCFFLKKKPLGRGAFFTRMILVGIAGFVASISFSLTWALLLPLIVLIPLLGLIVFFVGLFLPFWLTIFANFFIESRKMDINSDNVLVKYFLLLCKIVLNIGVFVSYACSVFVMTNYVSYDYAGILLLFILPFVLPFLFYIVSYLIITVIFTIFPSNPHLIKQKLKNP